MPDWSLCDQITPTKRSFASFDRYKAVKDLPELGHTQDAATAAAVANTESAAAQQTRKKNVRPPVQRIPGGDQRESQNRYTAVSYPPQGEYIRGFFSGILLSLISANLAVPQYSNT